MFFQLYYLPCIEFFTVSDQYEILNFNENDEYSKQSYRTRCYILGANKVEILTIPVNKKPLTKDVTIDYKEDWQRIHWRTIKTAYNKSPYFEYYDYLFEPLYDKKIKYLMDFNFNALSICHKILKTNKTICLIPKNGQNVPNFHLNAKNRTENHALISQNSYSQNFGNKFEPNLSIIDLIFNKGPESYKFIKINN